MTKSSSPMREDEHPQAQAKQDEHKQPTDDELLDEAVEETFPASDPISPTAAAHTQRSARTGVNDSNSNRQPASASQRQQCVVAAFDDESRARKARDEALRSKFPTARLELPAQADGTTPCATLRIAVHDSAQLEQARAIAQHYGATKIDTE